MAITVLVEFGDRRKKIVLDEAGELIKACKEKFEISDEKKFALEIMETEFSTGVWIDLDTKDDLSNGSRLRIVVRDESDSQDVIKKADASMADNPGPSSVGARAGCDIESVGGDVFMVLESSDLESGRKATAADELDPLCVGSCANVGALSTCSTVVVDEEDAAPSLQVGASPSDSRRPPVAGFPEESLSLHLKRKLHSEEPLDGSDWSQLMGAMYEMETKLTMFPAGSAYERIAQTILDAYPYLGGRLSGYEARAFVKAKVINKFRNSRRKRRSMTEEEETGRKRQQTSFEGLPNYSPLTSGPQIAYTAMANEMKETEDKEIIRDLMWKTLPDRRKILAATNSSWEEFFERYPQLLNCEEIWNELARLAGDQKGEGTPLRNASEERLRGLLQKVQRKANMREYDAKACLRELAENIGCSLERVVSKEPDFTLNTVIQEEQDAFKLLVGSKVAVDLPAGVSMETAVCTWAATFPVLNIKFPGRNPRAMCVLLYREVLGLNGGPCLNPKSLALLRCL